MEGGWFLLLVLFVLVLESWGCASSKSCSLLVGHLVVVDPMPLVGLVRLVVELMVGLIGVA